MIVNEVLFLWCVQEVAELKEEDIISHTAHAPVAPPSVLFGDPSKTLSEFSCYKRHIHSCLQILSLPEAIDDLKDVLHVTDSIVRWKDLGLQLGLSYSTLEAIEMERCKKVNDCRMDMFVAWLRMKDKVSTVGEPSWRLLKFALRKVGEDDVADKI